jgi:hypothetical protein
MHRPEKWGNLCRRLRPHADACGGMQPHAVAHTPILFLSACPNSCWIPPQTSWWTHCLIMLGNMFRADLSWQHWLLLLSLLWKT